MNRSGMLVLALCVLAAGCDDNPTAPTNAPLVFSALLSPANEVPAIANAESSGRGAVQATFNVTRDAANVVSAATVTFYFQLFDFPGNTTVTGAHIHSAGAGINGAIVVNAGVSGTAAVTLPGGTGTYTVSGLTADPVIVQQIINNPGAFYFNVHSPLNPGGFARGQLIRVQ